MVGPGEVVLPLRSKCLIHFLILLQQWQLSKEKQNQEILMSTVHINYYKTPLISEDCAETCGKNHYEGTRK